MKGTIHYFKNNERIEKEVAYIPFRFCFAILLAGLEIAAILAIVVAMCVHVPYFYLLVQATEIACVVSIIASDDNPDYKVPWLLVVLAVPVAGFMLYFLFYSRKLKRKYIRRLKHLKHHAYEKDDFALFEQLGSESVVAHHQANMLCKISEAHLFTNTRQTYFKLGDEMFPRILEDLRNAEKFIFLEYFIIEEGVFWNSILEILKEKAARGVEVKVVYDDIGCMRTLPGDYYKTLKSFGIDATPFSMLKGNADGEFNNRSHRKILVIDGKIGYTGGVNLADEYINQVERFGHWKDIGIRLEGDAVKELTKLFWIDYGLNVRRQPTVSEAYFPELPANGSGGYMVPFGDGPNPIYKRRVGKIVIQNLVSQANRHVHIMTPYLIIDNELCQAIENAALRGVSVQIIVPHIPDKKLVFEMTKSYYHRLLEAGVELYEYEPGFIHAKSYLVDGEFAMMGTINLDYRSLVHHFENGVWMYHCDCIQDMEKDFAQTLGLSLKVDETMMRPNLLMRLVRSLVKTVSPLL